MSDEVVTKPMLETILKEMRAGFESMDKRLIDTKGALSALEARLSNIEHRLDIVESQLVQMDARNDRIESIFLQGRSEILGLRADFKEFRSQFKAPA